MIRRTHAIVLRAIPYSETSQIVTLFTELYGKETVMARGSRRQKSRFGSALQPMSFVEIVYYFKAGRNVQTLSEAAHVKRFDNLSRDLEKIALGLSMVELLNALVQDADQQPGLFALAVDALARLDAAHEYPQNVRAYFQVRMAQELGFSPAFTRDEVETLPDDGGVFMLSDGSIAEGGIGSRGSDGAVRASRSALRALAVLALAPPEVMQRMRLTDPVRNEVDALITGFLRYHVEQSYPTRAERVVRQLIG